MLTSLLPKATTLAAYYILNDNVYQSPSLYSVVNERVVRLFFSPFILPHELILLPTARLPQISHLLVIPPARKAANLDPRIPIHMDRETLSFNCAGRVPALRDSRNPRFKETGPRRRRRRRGEGRRRFRAPFIDFQPPLIPRSSGRSAGFASSA